MVLKKIFSKSVLTLVALAVSLGGTLGYVLYEFDRETTPPIQWESYASQDDRFEAEFPSAPAESTQEMTVANKRIAYNEVASETEDSKYAVGYIDFPGIWKWAGDQKILTKSFDALMQEEQVDEILEHEMSSHHGFPALKYCFSQGGKLVVGKLVVVGNTLYRVVASCPQAAAEKVNPHQFLESFRLR